MPTNLIKIYPNLLEIMHLNEHQRTASLRKIFNRDIVNNPVFKFRAKQIWPIFSDGEATMGTLFNHLTRHEIEIENEDGTKYKRREFEQDRSMRLHWIKYHIDENKRDNIEIFSIYERDNIKRKDIIRTYIYDLDQKYVVVLEPKNTGLDYYLLTAYYLNKSFGSRVMKKKLKKRLDVVH